MFKRIGILAFVLAVVAVFGTGSGSVVINEIDLNPPKVDAYSAEWVELFNNGGDDVDVSGWMVVILSGIWSGKMTVPPGTVLGSGKYYVLTGDPRWTHGTNGTAVLTSSIGEEIDRTPMLNDTKSDDFTWSRWPNGRDSDRISDWAYIPSSKGRANKVPYTDQ